MLEKNVVRSSVEGTKVRAMSAVVHRISGLMARRPTSTSEIADEIAKDPILAAKVLKLVNSGFYGFRQPITTITHAMVLLGLDVVRSLVMTASVMDEFEAARSRVQGLWEHSLGTARTCQILAERLKLPNPEEVALCGLLHDFGKVIIAQTFPAEFSQIDALVRERGCLQIDAEREVLGVMHPEVGMWLLKKWSLSPALVYPVVYHSNFHPRRDYADRTAVVHLADILARAKGIGNPGDQRMPRMNPEAWAFLKLSMGDVERVCAQLDADVSDGLFG